MENNKRFLVHLPQDLILQILLRLPVKSLVRFKCVSKPWLSLISSPNFQKSHFELTATRSHRLLCYNRYQSEFLSIDPYTSFHDHPATTKLLHPLPEPSLVNLAFRRGPLPWILTLGFCRGFILIDDYDPNDLILWNPSTRFRKRISYSHIFSTLLFGFGYDPSNDDYLVVIAWKNCREENHFQFFSLRTNSWEDLEVAIPDSYVENHIAVFLNGAIHWLCIDDGIIVFDLIERKFSDNIPLHWPATEPILSASLMVLGGCLSICYQSGDMTKVEVWVMKEYKVQSSWTMYEIFDFHFYPVCLAEGGEIIGLDGVGELVKYNDKGQMLERCAHRYHFLSYTTHIESLLSLPSDSEEEKEDDQQ